MYQMDALVRRSLYIPDRFWRKSWRASKYPLEIVQIQQGLIKNKDLEGHGPADAAAKQPGDSSIQALAGLQISLKRLLTKSSGRQIGQPFLAQQSDFMDRSTKACAAKRRTREHEVDEQMKVETNVVESRPL